MTAAPDLIAELRSQLKDLPPVEQARQVAAKGDSNDQIARALGLSINTVKFHLRNLYDKLAIKNRAQAVAFYYSTTRDS